ncbi:hypothetical protein NA57DRAFT_75143 [Rhizodiscina lignyota]|uniref:PWWP domain-containing protein n=1 Tax=Rhizodiscina lignyota TaxID=1504668 RepID=A0A9P4M757_9PEZI|nr:hypothetical protein NA57DRAFT_75143 [Rhizodiscina lignyota]
MAEQATDQPPVVPPAAETAVEVADTTSGDAPAADPAVAAPPTADDAPSKAEEPATTTVDTDKPTAPTTADDDPATTEDKTMADVNGDKAEPAAEDAPAADGTPGTGKKDNKRRKSSAVLPEHKNKSLKKKQSKSVLHLNVEPGQFWFVRMKGYPPWPAVICDEEMLPTVLLQNRPVSAMRTDGSYREDFLEDGKNARDRRYPVMFLGTNEFNWVVNTDLEPLDMDEIKAEVSKETRGKKTIALWEAYHVAAEEHTLDEFKEMLRDHEKRVAVEAEEKAAKEAKKAEKAEKAAAEKEKKTPKKPAAKDEDGDETMGGTEGKKKSTQKKEGKKRKASEDLEDEVPSGPKRLKINNKDADLANQEKKKEAKPRKKPTKPTKDDEPLIPAEPVVSEKEKQEKKEKHVLYLRHRLQKGFLSRDQAPKEEEMDSMNDYFNQLEACLDLEVHIIRATKINKVLKAILKLDTIPKDDEYKFKDRSNVMLNNWNKVLAATGAADGDAAAETPTTTEAPKPLMNGASHDEEKSEEPKDAAMSEPAEGPQETTELGNGAVDEADADVSMTDAKATEAEAPPAASAAKEEDKPVAVAEEESATA